jgi:hypothetical protein
MNLVDKIRSLFRGGRVIKIIVFEDSQLHAIRQEDFKKRGKESREEWIKRIQEKAVNGRQGDELAGSYAARYPDDKKGQLSTLQYSQIDKSLQEVIRAAYEKGYAPGDIQMPVRSMHKHGLYGFRVGLNTRHFNLKDVSLS